MKLLKKLFGKPTRDYRPQPQPQEQINSHLTVTPNPVSSPSIASLSLNEPIEIHEPDINPTDNNNKYIDIWWI